MLAMRMMDPSLRSTMCGSTSRHSQNVARTLVSMILSKAESGIPASGP